MVTVATQPRKMTAEEFAQHYMGKRAELINGEVYEYMPAGHRHGEVSLSIGSRIFQFVKRNRLGKAYGAETGFILRTAEGESVRAPDVAFIRKERIPEAGWSEAFCPIAPDLVVEVISPSDSYPQLRQKIDQWLSAGVQVVWVIDPERRVVEIWRPDGTLKELKENDTLTGEPVLPDFQVVVKELFE